MGNSVESIFLELTDKRTEKPKSITNLLPLLEIGNDLWNFLGHVLFKLRRNGLTIPFQDVVLTALALIHNA
jgi:hypothetical protein